MTSREGERERERRNLPVGGEKRVKRREEERKREIYNILPNTFHYDRDGDFATPKILVPPAVFSCWESGEELKIVVAGGGGEPRPSYRQKKVGKGEERFLAES